MRVSICLFSYVIVGTALYAEVRIAIDVRGVVDSGRPRQVVPFQWAGPSVCGNQPW